MAKVRLDECEPVLALSDLDLDILHTVLVLAGNITNEDSCNSKIVPGTGRRIRQATMAGHGLQAHHYDFTAKRQAV